MSTYSRTCPVKIKFNLTGIQIEGLAILDDQASISPLHPPIISRLGIKKENLIPTTLAVQTIEGTARSQPCSLVEGISVQSLDRTNEITLPPTYVYKVLPQAIEEIPDRKEVEAIPGLEHLAKYFPIKQEWTTVILIGRNCPLAQIQEQAMVSRSERQIASKTPLGWVLIGEHQSYPQINHQPAPVLSLSSSTEDLFRQPEEHEDHLRQTDVQQNDEEEAKNNNNTHQYTQ